MERLIIFVTGCLVGYVVFAIINHYSQYRDIIASFKQCPDSEIENKYKDI